MDPTIKGIEVPTGLAHFALIRAGGQHSLEMSEPFLQTMKPKLEFVGWALAALYEVGTCNRKCWGGPHLLESLSVRVYNLGVSAYLHSPSNSSRSTFSSRSSFFEIFLPVG